ncbi:MAG: hypothetical protein E4H03_06265 [Myxococcales bacterium]|jgi:hypothetical protein|nr:MAG: hypothetical protein E4H03_06265 [Myxococcales bacterium]
MLRIFKVFAVLAVALVVVGYFRDWFEVSKPGSDEYAVKVDRDKIGEDTKAARHLATKVGKQIAGRRVTGTVKYLNPLTMSLTVNVSDDEDQSFKLSTDTRITRGGETAGLLDLADLSKVAVTYAEVDGDKKIEEIEILD